MPYEIKARKGDKSSKNKLTQNKPIITIFSRNKMTSTESKTQPMTKEHKITTVRSIKAGVLYIETQGNVNHVYILRDDRHQMIHSYSFNTKWQTINMGNYFGGFKIGNPKPYCSCGAGMVDDPDHPSCRYK
jgi:hypothetical protein